MKTKYFILTIAIATLLSTGCGVNDPNESISNETSLTNETTENSQEIGESQIEETDELKISDITKDEVQIWDKEKVEISMETMCLDKDWHSYIYIDGIKVSSLNTDVSLLSNYFFDEQNSYADLETAYLNPDSQYTLSTENTKMLNNISGQMSVVTTTYDKYALVENVRFVTISNPYEGDGLNTFANHAAYTKDGKFGIGSTYSYVTSIIGEPTSTLPLESDEDICTQACIFDKDGTKMFLVFMWEKEAGMESAVLTSVEWQTTSR